MCGIHQEKRREKLGETRYTHVASYKTSVMEDGLQSVKVDLKKKKTIMLLKYQKRQANHWNRIKNRKIGDQRS